MGDPSRNTIQRGPARGRQPFAPGAAAILLLGLLAMWPVLRSDFSLWDDVSTIAENHDLTPPTLAGLADRWTGPHMNIYVPLTHTVWTAIAWLVYDPSAARPLPPWPFKIASLATHLATSLVVFALLRRAVGPRWPALAAALFFCVHPLQVEAVAWTSGLKDLLCGLLSAACVLIYLGDRDAPTHLSGRRVSLALVALILAMLAKPIALTVPAMLLAIDLLWLRRPTRESIARLVPFFILAGACAFFARAFQEQSTLVPVAPLWSRPLLAGFDFAFYLVKAVWPVGLAFDYGLSPTRLLEGRAIYVAWLVPVAAAAAAWMLRRRLPLVGVGLVLAALPLLPVSGLVYFDYSHVSLVGDHYVYLPMIGGAIAVAALLHAAAGRGRAVGAAAAALVILAWAGLSMRQAMTWRDAMSVAQQTLRVNPDSGPTANHLGGLALRAGDLAAAEAWQRKSLARNAGNPAALLTLGDIALRRRRFEEAIDWYGRAARLVPGTPQPWYGLGQAYIANNQPAEAVAAIERGLLSDDAPRPAREWLDQIKGVMRARAATQRAAATTQAAPPTDGSTERKP